jgi:uncharacterized protein (TIGR00255 family)
MIESMTGFGKSVCELPGKVVTIEIRALNSKQLDIYTRLPNIYKEKELDLRNSLSQQLIRGKIELCISYENTDISGTAQINIPLVKSYYEQLQTLVTELNDQNQESLLQTIMRFPDVLKIEKEELDLEEWQLVNSQVNEALRQLILFRKQEGRALQQDIQGRIDTIQKQLNDIESFEGDRIIRVREKITSAMQGLTDQFKIDENRLEQELIYYLEKLDVTEEKVRLGNHCDFFREVADNENANGKKLSFIAQEIGREINTIGSKANHSDIQRIVVQMKDELEKIKEQLMNVL